MNLPKMETWHWEVFPGVELWLLRSGSSVVVYYDVDLDPDPITRDSDEHARLQRRGLALTFGEA